MSEATYEPHTVLAVLRRAVLEDVVHVACVGLQIAAEAAEQVLYERAGVRLGICEQDRVAVDDGGEEVPLCGVPPYAESNESEPVFSVVNARSARHIIFGV
jgi:hypothetical protein